MTLPWIFSTAALIGYIAWSSGRGLDGAENALLGSVICAALGWAAGFLIQKGRASPPKISPGNISELHERVEEFACLYAVSKIVENRGITIEEMLSEIVEQVERSLAPSGVLGARVLVMELEFKSQGFRSDEKLVGAKFNVSTGGVGQFEIAVSRTGSASIARRDFLQAIAARITESYDIKHADEALHASEQRFRDILEVASDWFWEMDQDLRFTYISDRFFEGNDLAPRDVLNKAPMDIEGFEPERRGRKSWRSYVKILEAQKPFFGIEFKLFSGDANEQYIRISGKPIFDGEGNFSGYRGAATNITAQKQTDELLKGSHDALELRVQERTLELQVEIAERKRAEQALLDSERRFKDVAEASSDWIWELDEEMEFTVISERFRDILGEDVGVLRGKKPQDAGLTVVDSNRQKTLQRILVERKPFRDFSFSLMDHEKKQRYIKVSGKPIFEGDQFKGYRGTATDITEHTRTEFAIRKLSRTVEQSPAIIAITDPQGLIEYVNPRFTTVTGYSLSEVIGKSPQSFMILEEPQSGFEDVWRMASQGQEWHGEIHNRRKNGELYWAAASISPVKGEEGGITNFIYTAEDVTERKDAEAQIRFQASLLDQVRNAVVATDLDGRIAYWNKFAEVVFQREGVRVLGKHFDEVVQISALSEAGGNAGWGRAGDDYYEGEFVTQRSDGSQFPAFMTTSRISGRQGEDIGFVRVILDLTERKRVEAQLVQASKLATLGEMAAGMTHELNQPINIIRMTSDASIMDIDDGMSEPQGLKEKFNVISSQTERMAEIIDHMRVLSRKDEMEHEVFDPFVAVEEVGDLLSRQFKAEGVVVEFQLSARRYPVKGRKVQLEQVMLNLLTNARDAIVATGAQAGKESGVIGKIRVQGKYARKSDELNLIICDTGPGIPEEQLNRIFEPFFTTKEAGQGTGLGLSVSMSIIDRMGATIEVRNRRGRESDEYTGAEFKISIPVNRENKAWRRGFDNAEVAQRKNDGNAKGHLLIVDDEILAADILNVFFGHKGYRVSLAHDGVEAMDRFMEDPADLVITDIRMPHRDGNELIRCLHEQVPELPIIVATGQMEMDELRLGDEDSDTLTGPAAVFRKPLNLAELEETVKVLLTEE